MLLGKIQYWETNHVIRYQKITKREEEDEKKMIKTVKRNNAPPDDIKEIAGVVIKHVEISLYCVYAGQTF